MLSGLDRISICFRPAVPNPNIPRAGWVRMPLDTGRPRQPGTRDTGIKGDTGDAEPGRAGPRHGDRGSANRCDAPSAVPDGGGGGRSGSEVLAPPSLGFRWSAAVRRCRAGYRGARRRFEQFPLEEQHLFGLFAKSRLSGLRTCGPGTLVMDGSARAVRLRRTGKSDAAIGSWMLGERPIVGESLWHGRLRSAVREMSGPVGNRRRGWTGATVLPGAVIPVGPICGRVGSERTVPA